MIVLEHYVIHIGKMSNIQSTVLTLNFRIASFTGSSDLYLLNGKSSMRFLKNSTGCKTGNWRKFDDYQFAEHAYFVA